MAFELPPSSAKRLDDLYKRLQDDVERFVGYPCTAEIDYRELFRFLEFPINNVGDPYKDGTLKLHTHDFEREVIDWFGRLLQAPENSFWGYVTNGGTEGNLYGLYLARELFPSGMTYYSEDTHYSVAKNLRVLNMQNIMINSQPSGELDYEDLRETIKINRHIPPIIFANIGTTMREGIDRIDRIREILDELAIPGFYIHCDAALAGMTLPFIDGAPEFDFSERVDSISISGHKFIGSPIPCGLVLADRNNVQRIARSIEYVGTLDTTITGSRNAFSPLILWYAIQRWGYDGFKERVASCLENAEYAVKKFLENGVEAWKNPHAITVVFPRPSDEIIERWQIAVQEEIGHLLVMPHVTRELIDEFVADYLNHPDTSSSAADS
ncbi:MAG: histidine decarboxylase [Verrucomicrobiales bacterium]|nr:histidine decarboxylase [Verrucomicrobiales bacterium]